MIEWLLRVETAHFGQEVPFDTEAEAQTAFSLESSENPQFRYQLIRREIVRDSGKPVRN